MRSTVFCKNRVRLPKTDEYRNEWLVDVSSVLKEFVFATLREKECLENEKYLITGH